MITDTHCHLNFYNYPEETKIVIENARKVGVERILDPAVDLVGCKKSLMISRAYPEVFSAVGIHPNSSRSWNSDSYSQLSEYAKSEYVKAIGEIGLDYYRDRAPTKHQRQVFQHQLQLAAEFELPVVIHNRDSSEDVYSILSDWISMLKERKSPLLENPGVLHSFSESLAFAENIVELGFLIGISGPVTFSKAHELHLVVRDIPLDRLLVETDSPFLSPVPYRGKPNQPSNVKYVIEKITELKNIGYDFVADKTTKNAERLFNWTTQTEQS